MKAQQLATKIKAAQQEYLRTKAAYETKCTMARECQNKVLSNNEFYPDEEMRDNGRIERITDSKLSYLMNDDDFRNYLSLCHVEYQAAGIMPDNPEFIPEYKEKDALKEAENTLLDFGDEVIRLSPIFTAEQRSALKNSRQHIEHRKTLLDLILSLDTKTLKM